MPSSNITGRWMGHYVQYGRNHPIVANFFESGLHISGSMQDGKPECEYSLFEIAAELGLSSQDKEAIEASCRDLVPHAPADSIHYLTRLPSESSIEFRHDGQAISFAKTYAGECFAGYKVGGEIIDTQMGNHTVYYEGNLSYDNLEIEGRWVVEAKPEYGTREAEGSFVLRRVEQELVTTPADDKSASRSGPPWWKFW
jgi:hypothetical protein